MVASFAAIPVAPLDTLTPSVMLAICPAPPSSTSTDPVLVATAHVVRRTCRAFRRRSAPRTAMAVGAGDGAMPAHSDLPTVSCTEPDGVTGDLPIVSVTPPAGTASSVSEGNALGDLPTVGVTAPRGEATGAAVATGALPTIIVITTTGSADGGAPASGTGWSAKLCALGARWRIAWRPMSTPAVFPTPVSPCNDHGVLIDSVAGWQLSTGAPIAYGGTTITAYWAGTP